MASAVAGPSRPTSRTQAPPAPSTSGDSESTVPQPADKGLSVEVLREVARTSLIDHLNDIQGSKTLILDPALAGPLGLVTDVSLLKHQAVERMFWLQSGSLNVSTRNVVWLCRPKMGLMRTIAQQIRAAQTAGESSLTYTVLLVPRSTELCRKVLEDEGVAGDVHISEYKLGFIPIADDLLSLELDNAPRDLFLVSKNGDDTPIYYSSLALMTIQRAFGLFPRILGKGDGAKKLSDLLLRHHRTGDAIYADLEPSSQIDGLIVLDRSVDWITPMCTQLTYEGMIDEFIGIKNANIEIDAALLESGNQPPPPAPLPAPAKKRKHQLSAQKDLLLGEIRDLNFAVVGSRLSKLARRLEGDFGGVKNLKSVTQMKDFVGKLGGLQSEQQSLRLHTGLTEQLMPVTKTEEFNKTLEAQQNLVAGYDANAQYSIIEDLLDRQAAWSSVLRTAIIHSLTNGGLKPKVLEGFKRDFLQTYGYHHLPLFIALENLQLLVRSPPPSPQPFPALRKSLRLIVDDVDDGAPNDIAYVYSGYAPVSCRLVQCVTQKNTILSGSASGTDQSTSTAQAGGAGKKEMPAAHPLTGWRGFEDVMGIIPGETVDVRQRALGKDGRVDRQIGTDKTKTSVVFFLGGCTYTEVAALRWMSKQTRGRRFLITTTGMINGTTLLESFGDPQPVNLTS